MNKKKILHVLYSGQGGLGTYFMNFVNSDQAQHFEHHAFFYGIEPLNQELNEFCQHYQIPFTYQRKQAKIDLKGLKSVLSFRKQHDIRYVLLHTFSLSLLTLFGLVSKWKVVSIDHTPYQVKNKLTWLFTLLNHLFASKMIYFYEGHFKHLKDKFPLLSFGSNSHIIPKNVDINFFKPAVEKANNAVFTIGTTARLIQGKRHDLIIRAIQKLTEDNIEVHLKIAGNGPLAESLKILSQELGVANQVEFVGLLNRMELVKFYQSLDTYIHASEGETICYSIMEAQACGLPILASDVEGINNVIDNQSNGVLFENNKSSIAEEILQLSTCKEKLMQLGLNSRETSCANSSYSNSSNLLYTILTQ
jgi:glycosyltransferase involved in cell wall biosynthesis